MKLVLCLLAGLFVLALPVRAEAQRLFPELRGPYVGTAIVETASDATGAVTVDITTRKKKPQRATIQIQGTLAPANAVPGTGNAIPMSGRISFRGRSAIAGNFLLGLGAGRAESRPGRLSGRNGVYRFELVSAAGEGLLRCLLRVKDGVLTLNGRGFFAPEGGSRQPVSIFITAAKLVPAPTPTPAP